MIKGLFVMKLDMRAAEAKLNNETSFNEKTGACKTRNFFIILAFLLITIALWIDIIIDHDKTSSKTVIIISLHKELIFTLINML